MKVLVFTTVFPNPAQPAHGLFVYERLRHTAARVQLRLVVPVCWFRRRGIRRHERYRSLPVSHPSFFYLPGVCKVLDGLWLFLSSIWAVHRVRRRFDFDVIDAHFGFPDGVAAVLLGRWFRRPVVLTLRGSELTTTRFALRARMLRWAIARADRVVAVSHELAELATGAGPSAPVQVIENGVAVNEFTPLEKTTARRALGVPDRAILIVSVGHLAPIKGFDLFLRSLPPLFRELPSAQYVIVGGPSASSGRYPARLQALIEALGLSGRVTITGTVARDAVVRWLSAADLFVLSSEREGSPNALREALACGCPVVAADVGDVRRILSAEAGLIVGDRQQAAEWHRAVRTALRSEWDRAAIRASVESCAWSGVAARTVEAWHACVVAAGCTPDRAVADRLSGGCP